MAEKNKLAGHSYSSYEAIAQEVTFDLVYEIIEGCRIRKINYIVAPYAADAQLPFFSMHDYVDLVYSEDSDLMVFGCEKLITKVTPFPALLYDINNLDNIDGRGEDQLKTFRWMCVLAGCDYVNLPTVGIKTVQLYILENRPL